MFAAVVLEESGRKGLWGALLDRLRPLPLRKERQQLGDCSYWLITCPISSDGSHWSQLTQMIGRYGRRLVVDRSISIPAGLGLKRYESSVLAQKLLANTAIHALTGTGIDPARRTVGLIDCEGVFQELAATLVDSSSCVRVITRNPNRYDEFCQRMLDEHGATVLIGSEPSSLSDCLMVISPSDRPERIPSGCPVFSLAPGGVDTITDLRIAPSSFYACAVPLGVDPMYFFSALYDLGGISELGEMISTRCRWGGRDIGIDELIVMLRLRGNQLARSGL